MKPWIVSYFFAILVSTFISTTADSAEWTIFPGDGVTVPNEISSMAVDCNGVVWVGGRKGLWSYDGVEWTTWWLSDGQEWLVFPGEDKPVPWTLPHCITVDKDNELWIGLYGGIVKYDGEKWNFIEKDDNIFISSAVDQENVKWFGTGRNGIWSYDNAEWRHYPVIDNKQFKDARIFADSNNVKWVTYNYGSTEDLWGISSYDGMNWNVCKENINGAVFTITGDNYGVLWLGTFLGGLTRYSDGELLSNIGNEYVISENISCIAIGPDNTKWIGTDDYGVISHNGDTWSVYNTSKGLLDNNVNAIIVSSDNVVWVGTNDGVSRYTIDSNPSKIHELPTQEIKIKGNYPNPFNPVTTIEFILYNDIDARIDVINVSGHHIKTLKNEKFTAGIHSVDWDGTNDFGKEVASGVYFYRITADKIEAIHRMTLMR